MAGRLPERNFCQNWDEYFMTMALACSKLSRNPYTQVGACIVNNNQELISLGYNGIPRTPCEYQFSWYTGPRDYNLQRHIYVPHAEINALRNRYISDIRGSTIYVTLFPCHNCAMEIIGHGIREVLYLSDQNYSRQKIMRTKMIFDLAGVIYRPVNRMVTINYSNFETKQS